MKTKENHIEELTALRDSGMINMFGAPKYLRDNYGYTKKEATEIFNNWVTKISK